MPADEAAERTEQPTPRRREQAREQGQVPYSQDLTAAVGLLVGLLLLYALGPRLAGGLLEQVRAYGARGETDAAGLPVAVDGAIRSAAMLVLPLLGLLLLAGVAGGWTQSGWCVTWRRVQPRLERLSPLRGAAQLLSLESLRRLGMGLLKVVVLGAVAWHGLKDRIGQLVGLGGLSAEALVRASSELIFRVSVQMALALLVLGLVDYLIQRRRIEQSLRMTKQELKEELKRMEGDPLLRSRRRQVHMRLVMQRLNVDVPKADVVVTNPTEYAVALRYDEATMQAPRVVAKGVDLLALRIRQIAWQHGIPVVQRPALARGLYAAVQVGQEIPPAFYRAVAELLAYVYRLTSRVSA